MIPEAQRIAIARACGWTDIAEEVHPAIKYIWGFKDDQKDMVPDYLNDLNACYDFEETLNPQRVKTDGTYDEKSLNWGKYFHHLLRICERDIVSSGHANTSQRCEAFLRTLNLWKE